MTSVTPPLDELTGLVDEELRGFLEERKEGLPDGAPLLDEIGRVLAAGGKRLRPAFCYWGYRASGAKHAETI
ncbi:MAG TPA: polyprenyl synthetase family protein, partial [Actinomycetota bacterium]|nr:polyprenyl synthetase family protein [Actinomycetota bacterium]